MNYRYLFGPVRSRRLGISLGIDLVQQSICSLDCVYCECGKTALRTLERREYVPAAAIMAELREYLKSSPDLDYITFGGKGEPTLNSGIGEVVACLKREFPQYRCALLTNGTLLWMPEVRSELLPFDLVLPNLDAVSAAAFEKVNRPDPLLDNEKIISGLAAFRKEYHGTIWLEVFIVPGVNDNPEELRLLRDAAAAIGPDRIQLNTLDRPGACDWVKPADVEELKRIAALFSPLPVEIITRQVQESALWPQDSVSRESILALIARRPSTIEEIASLTGRTINHTGAILDGLLASGSITARVLGNRTFYRIA